jgi:hypothetical protein
MLGLQPLSQMYAALAVVSWMGIIFFIANYAMHLGGTTAQVG